ncbi:MAG TPA: FolB domain-containing protein [Campylobacteraceae bacterium]|nr:FolB domain-containing protein [Campylobacteraceae bacterium]
MPYTITIEALQLEAVIGVLDAEREKEQPVTAECEIVYERGEDDVIVDYALVAAMIVDMLKKGQYFLLEDALSEIVEAIKASYPVITAVRLKLCKPQILQNCNVCVEKSIKY